MGYVRAVRVAYRCRRTFRQDHNSHRLPLAFNLRIRYSFKFDDKVIRWFYTAHNKMAAVVPNILSVNCKLTRLRCVLLSF